MQTKTINSMNSVLCNAVVALNLSTFTNGQGATGMGIEARRNGIGQIVLVNTTTEQIATHSSGQADGAKGTIRHDSQMILAGGCLDANWISTCLAGGVARAELSLSSPIEFYRANKSWIPVARLGASAPLLSTRDQRVTLSVDASRFWNTNRGGVLTWEKQTLRPQGTTHPDLSLSGGTSAANAPSAQYLSEGIPTPGRFLDGLTTIGLALSVHLD